MLTEIYFYVEDLGLTGGQRGTIINQLQAWGTRNEDANPRNRNHWRVRQDGKAALFEVWLDDGNLTAGYFRQLLAELFGVGVGTISESTGSNAFGDYADFSYASVARLRLGVFGGVGASYAQSQAAAVSFLTVNAGAWG